MLLTAQGDTRAWRTEGTMSGNVPPKAERQPVIERVLARLCVDHPPFLTQARLLQLLCLSASFVALGVATPFRHHRRHAAASCTWRW